METGHQTENPTLSSNLFKSCHKKIRRYINIYLMGAILAIIYIYICIICTIIYCVIFWWRDHESWSPADRVAVSLKASQQAVGPAANTAQAETQPAVVTAAGEKPKKKEKGLQISDMNFS